MDSEPNRGIIFVLSVVITGTFCFFGFIGNILALIVLVRDKHKNSNVFLLSALAVSDWLMLLFIFHGVVVIQVCKFLHHVTCLMCMQRVLRTLWAMGCTVQLATAWCVVAVTWDRVMAISKPFKSMKKVEHVQRAKKLIALVFVFSVTFNIPRWFHFRIIESETTDLTKAPEDVNQTGLLAIGYNSSDWIGFGGDIDGHLVNRQCEAPCSVCNDFDYTDISNLTLHTNSSVSTSDILTSKYSTPKVRWLWQNKVYHYLYYIVLSWMVYYVIPICSLVVLNFYLIRQIRMCIKNQREIAPASRRGRKDSISITINIVAVVTIFVICQIPDFIHSLITDPDFGVGVVNKKYMGAAAYVFLSFNSSINFGVYCLFYGRFRKRLLAMLCPRMTKHQTQNRLFNKASFTSQSYL